MTIFRFALKRTLSSKLDILFLFFLPVIMVFISAESWLHLPVGFQFYGMLIMFMSAKLCKLIMMDRESQVVLRIQVAPISHFRYLAENLLAYTLIMTAIAAVVVGLGAAYYGSDLREPLNLFLLFSVFSLTSIGISIAWYSLFRNSETAYSILGGFYMIIAMLGGLLWPHEIMPEWIQKFLQILPTYWLSVGLRQISYQQHEGNFYFTLSVLILFGIAFILLGSRRKLS